MKATTNFRSNASVVLILCATLFIVTHCQHQHQVLNHNDPSEDNPNDLNEKPQHLTKDDRPHQQLPVQHSEQRANQQQSENLPPPQQQQSLPQATRQHISISPEHPETDRHHPNHEQKSHTHREIQQEASTLQNSHKFSSQAHEHLGTQHAQPQQQQPHSHKPEQGGDYSSQNVQSQHQHLDQQRHAHQVQHEHSNREAHIHGEQQHRQHFHHEQVQANQQQQHQEPEHPSSVSQQVPSSSQPPVEQTPPSAERQVSHQDTSHDEIVLTGEVLPQEPPHKQVPPADPVPLVKPPYEEPVQTEQLSVQAPSSPAVPPPADNVQHQERNSKSLNQHYQDLNQDAITGETSPTGELPNKGNAGDQAVFPPVLKGEVDEEDSDEAEEEEGAEEIPEPELTPEEIEAEDLFMEGEKLINATYYKEYHEAYLNFLEASKLNHQKAKEYVAFGHLFGDYLPQNVTRSAELFEELAAKGSPRAQMGLAFMYSAGFFYNSSQAKALIFSTFGALGGDPLAQMALGYRYYAGIGVESTCETALTYYRKVATKVADSVTLAGGPVVQRISLQDEAENVGTNNSPMLDDDLLQYYHFLADKGDQQAQVVLGTLYYQGGKGVQINHEQAYHYFSTAAESGSGHALGYLGKMHSEGSPFIKQNNQTAFEFFKKSSEKNNHIGQAGLGMMYLNGLGVDKDVTKAFRYFSLASDQGSVDGQLQLGIMYFSGNGIRTDYKLAVKYFTMASQKGHVLAYYNLAQMHATGTGVLRNCHTAVELFKNVAERGKWSEMMMDAHRMYHEGNVDTALVKYMFLADLGYEVAQSNVAYLLDSGATLKFNVHESHQRALLQYSRAASQGSTLARLKMGDYYYYGLGTDVDYESAASHYRMASEQQNNAQAMFNLGYMHERGLGLKQDVHLAKRFYDMAAETSVDAHVPVTMALLKLGLLYGVDVFSKEFEGISGLLSLLDPMAYLGPQWDLFLASALAGFITLIFFMRRMR